MNEALKPENSEDWYDQQSLVTFRLGRQTYALPIEPLAQIIEMVTITPIPHLNSSVEGMINVRGTAVPVINLGRHFGLQNTPRLLRTPIILIRVEEGMVGLIVDEVLDVLRLSGEQVLHTPDILPEGLGELPLLQGLVHTANGTVLLLDPDHLLRSNHKQALAQAMTTLPQTITTQETKDPLPDEYRAAEVEGQHDR